MRSKWNSLVVGGCNVFGLALLVLSATGGSSAVRAEDPATLQGNVLERIVAGVEQRVAGLEASVAAFADSFTARRIAAQELCVGDGSGAQTCITKAQLDSLLRGVIQTGQAPAAIEPETTEQAASADASIAPVAAATMPPETPPAFESSDGALPIPQAGEGRVGDAAEAMPEVAAVPEADAVREVAAPSVEVEPQVPAVPQVEAAMPSAAQPTTEQPPAALSEAAAPLPAEAMVSPPAGEAAETVVAASGKPEVAVAVERPAKDEEPAQSGATQTTAATPEPKAAPTEAPPVSERVE